MKIANIIYEDELVNHVEVEFINYFKGSGDLDKMDKTLPTLYVGWSFMKKCNPNDEIIQNADILHQKIINNELYWEFSYVESKSSHIKGVENFVRKAPDYYFTPKYKYTNLDPVFFQITCIDDLIEILPKEIDAMYNHKNEMIYILIDNDISGINLKMFDFFKFDIQIIISEITKRSFNIYKDLDGSIYMSYYKKFPNFNKLKRYLISMLDY